MDRPGADYALSFFHLLGEHPERSMEIHAAIVAADLASAIAPAFRAASGQTTLEAVLCTRWKESQRLSPWFSTRRASPSRSPVIGAGGCSSPAAEQQPAL
jgi:hypothetical protein